MILGRPKKIGLVVTQCPVWRCCKRCAEGIRALIGAERLYILIQTEVG